MWLSSVLDTGDTAGKKRDKAYPSWGLPSSGEDGSKQTLKKIDKMIQTGVSAMKEIE